MALKPVKGGWVMVKETVVHHWRFETGEPEPVPDWMNKFYPTGHREAVPRGWYCWVYPQNNDEFLDWMREHCPTADCTHRFNSGDPMITVTITDDREATLFTLKWL